MLLLYPAGWQMTEELGLLLFTDA